MSSDDQVNAVDSTGHFHITLRLCAMLAVGVMPHVGGRNHHVSLVTQLGHHF